MGHPVESWNTLNIPDGEKELGEEEGEDDPREVLLGPRLDARPLQLDLQPSVVQQGQGHHRLQDLVPVGGEREQPSGRIGESYVETIETHCNDELLLNEVRYHAHLQRNSVCSV